jgi:DNA-binding MarR family transcriptional regulator
VAALVEQGVLERRVHPENARVMRCFIRPECAQAFDRGRRVADGVVEQMLHPMSKAERVQFKDSLRRCIAALECVPDSGVAER